MKAATPRSPQIRSPIGGIALTLGLAALLGGAYAMPARADDDRGRDQHQQPAHNDRDRGDHHAQGRGRPAYGYGQPAYGYGQPTYVYAPPPVYYEAPVAPPVLDFVFPLSFR
jgi:hypothetical protein